MSATDEPLILTTGFFAFPGAPENPTAWAIGELERDGWQPKGARLATRILPVRYDMWEREFVPLLSEQRPNAVVAFGLSAKATGFTLESTARNHLGLGRPDACGAPAPSAWLRDDGPATFDSALPLAEIAAALRRHELPFSPSDDAGDYVCNLLFYRLMAHIGAIGTPSVAGFIHVPYLDEQVARLALTGLPTAHLKSLSAGQLIQGTCAILSVVAETLAAR
jgi:pyroglutamyl-peptidase